MLRAIVTSMLVALALAACDQPKGQGGGAASAQQPVAVGTPAPDVKMTLHDGRTVTLRELRGSNVLVYFYPKDDTPG